MIVHASNNNWSPCMYIDNTIIYYKCIYIFNAYSSSESSMYVCFVLHYPSCCLFHRVTVPRKGLSNVHYEYQKMLREIPTHFLEEPVIAPALSYVWSLQAQSSSWPRSWHSRSAPDRIVRPFLFAGVNNSRWQNSLIVRTQVLCWWRSLVDTRSLIRLDALWSSRLSFWRVVAGPGCTRWLKTYRRLYCQSRTGHWSGTPSTT